MKKFKMLFKYPSNLHSNHNKEHREATPETHPEKFGETLLVLIGDRLFRKQPKHYTGVINLRAAGGKWEEITTLLAGRGLTPTQYLEQCKATEASFRGGPRLNK